MRKAFLTFLYTGLSPYAPGTAGSIAAAMLGFFLLQYIPLDTLFLIAILLCVIAVREINKFEADGGEHDDKSIVIDEVAGVWIAFVFSGATTWTHILLSLIYFRIFDIWKPSFIGRIDKNVKGGWGVMGDDLLAGVIAGICCAATFKFIAMV